MPSETITPRRLATKTPGETTTPQPLAHNPGTREGRRRNEPGSQPRLPPLGPVLIVTKIPSETITPRRLAARSLSKVAPFVTVMAPQPPAHTHQISKTKPILVSIAMVPGPWVTLATGQPLVDMALVPVQHQAQANQDSLDRDTLGAGSGAVGFATSPITGYGPEPWQHEHQHHGHKYEGIGQPANNTGGSLFGQPTTTSSSSSASPPFGTSQPAQSGSGTGNPGGGDFWP